MTRRSSGAFARAWWAPILLLTACAFGDASSRLSNERLSIEVVAPADLAARVRVSGPAGFVIDLSSSSDLAGLARGTYRITAEPVRGADDRYHPTPATQVITLGAAGDGGRPRRAVVWYLPETMTEPAGPDLGEPELDPPTASSYYLDCVDGDDGAAGSSPGTAWRTLDRLGSANLEPGDSLLLARGCSWVGPLTIRWSGTAVRPVLVGAYGHGDRPAIRDSSDNHVVVTGSHVIVEQLRAFTSPGTFAVDPACQDQPVGWRTGFTIADGASHVVVRRSQAYGNTIGVHIAEGASHARILDNDLFGNFALAKNTPGGDDDYGAWGVLVTGTDHEIAYNRFWDNFAWCSYDYGQDGAAIEVYAAQRNLIHHNVSLNDSAFVEVGSSRERTASDNLIAYNTYASVRPVAEFLMVHAGGAFGPTRGTRAFHNTVYLPHPERTQGVTCYGAACGPDVLELRNNVIVAGWRGIHVQGSIAESNNVFWRPGGDPFLEFLSGARMSSSSIVADPLLVDAERGDLRPRAGSPAIGAGTALGLPFLTDAAGQPLGHDGPLDAGAFAYRPVALAGTAD